MQDADRKAVWAAIFTASVIALELVWFIFVGPANNSANSAANQEARNLLLGLSAETWTAVFTGTLTASTIGLWVSTRKSTRIAERALSDMERAYVFFKDAIQVGSGTYEIVFINYGKTPAVIKSRRLACEYLENPPADVLGAPEHHFPKGAVIGSGDQWRRGKVTVTVEMLAQLRYGGGRVYLFGELKYWDLLGNEHRTWFCRRFNHHQFILDDLADAKLNGYD